MSKENMLNKNSDICVLIPTYNRPRSIESLIIRLKYLRPSVKIIVVDDASVESFDISGADTYHKFHRNNGKKEWSNIVNLLFVAGLRYPAQHYIFMPDDAIPNDDFFTRAFSIWNKIDDTNKIALHLANNGRESNWTKFNRIDYNKDTYLTQTTEFSFLCKREFITFDIPKSNHETWVRNPLLGSGVGNKLNTHWINQERTIYGVKKSLIQANPDCVESKMNKEERKKNKWKLL